MNALRGAIERSRQPSASSSYAGAQVNRLTDDWIWAPIKSADQEIRWDHRRLVGRARELARNDPYAHRFLRLLRHNVVGPHGIRMQARVARASGDMDTAINDRIEEEWRAWSRPQNCTADGRQSLRDVCGSVMEAVARDGEALVQPLRGWDNRWGYALRVLDPDLLDVDFNRFPSDRENEIRMGVEINRWGRPVAYHLFDRHPYDGGRRDRTRVPASDLWHLYLVERPGQSRGVTWLAPSMIRSKWLAGYSEAEIIAARTAACKQGFYTQDPATEPDPMADGDEEDVIPSEAEPGRFDILPPGVDITPWDPQHPNSAFDAFERSILRGIAMGWDVAYSSLSGDLSDVNFSSIRAGIVQERDVYQWLQQWLVEHLLDLTYDDWFLHALTAGALELPARNMARWKQRVWQPRGWQWVNPAQEVKAHREEVDAGLNSLTSIAASQGRDIEEVFRERKNEIRLAEKYGVPLGGAAKAPPPGPARREEDDEDDSDEAAAVLVGSPNGNGHRWRE